MKNRERFTNRLCLLGLFLLSSMAAQPQSNVEAWVRRYNSAEAGSADYARKIVTDPDGNVVVAGDTDDKILGETFWSSSIQEGGCQFGPTVTAERISPI